MIPVISIAISKGGVGKTTTAVNLAAEFGLHGYKVLLIDTDEQGNATFSATGKTKEEFEQKGIFNMLKAFNILPPSNFISPTLIPNTDIIPANSHTAQALHQLPILQSEYKFPECVYLSMCISQVKEDYDVVIIDTPPAKNTLTQSALYASDHVIIPVKADKYCIDSLFETLALINTVEKNTDTKINLLGILLSMVEKTALTRVVEESLLACEYGEDVLPVEIRKTQAVNESTAAGKPVVMYNKRCNATEDYRALYNIVVKKLRMKPDKGGKK